MLDSNMIKERPGLPNRHRPRSAQAQRKTASIEAAAEAKRSRVEQFTAGDAKAPQKG